MEFEGTSSAMVYQNVTWFRPLCEVKATPRTLRWRDTRLILRAQRSKLR